MEDATQISIDMHEWIWKHFKDALKDLTPDEVDFRSVPEANTINLIVRHLRIEAEWQLAGIEQGKPMPAEAPPSVQQWIDSVPLDFERNMNELDELVTRFIAVLRRLTLNELQLQARLAYREFVTAGVSPPANFLAFHHAVHLSGHWGQISAIRNLYRRMRGEPGLFFPVNAGFPK